MCLDDQREMEFVPQAAGQALNKRDYYLQIKNPVNLENLTLRAKSLLAAMEDKNEEYHLRWFGHVHRKPKWQKHPLH